jgi:hypothetical protein
VAWEADEEDRHDLFLEYTWRRNGHSHGREGGLLDLGVCSLSEVVSLCVERRIVSSEVFIHFSFQVPASQESVFVERLNKRQFDLLGFEHCYFTPVDHRLLAALLVAQFPQEFAFPSQPMLASRALTNFYSFLYWLTDSDYQELCLAVNLKFCRSWMPSSLSSFLESLPSRSPSLGE